MAEVPQDTQSVSEEQMNAWVMRGVVGVSHGGPEDATPQAVVEANAALEAAVHGLRDSSTISRLILRGNALGPAGGGALAEALRNNTTLTHLNLGSCHLGAWGTAALARAVAHAPALATLDLRANHAGGRPYPPEDPGAHAHVHVDIPSDVLDSCLPEAWAFGLTANSPALTHLDLRSNALGTAGGVELAKGLEAAGRAGSSSLVYLNLRNNGLGAEVGVALGAALAVSTTLETLILSNNSLGGIGACALFGVLADDETDLPLASLNLSYNNIGASGAIALANWLGKLRRKTGDGDAANDGPSVGGGLTRLSDINVVGNSIPLMGVAKDSMPTLDPGILPTSVHKGDRVMPAVVVVATAEAVGLLDGLDMFPPTTIASLVAHAHKLV